MPKMKFHGPIKIGVSNIDVQYDIGMCQELMFHKEGLK